MGRYSDKKRGRENRQKAYNYLVEKKGIPGYMAAGIIGNFMQESSIDLNVEAYNPNDLGKPSFGLAQWRGDRLTKLKEFAGDRINTMEGQLDFVVWELNNTEKRAFEKLKDTTNAEEAATVISKYYERPHKDYAHNDKRIANAKSVFLEFNDDNIYSKDGNGNIVFMNPDTADDVDIRNSEFVKREFYNDFFSIENPKPVQEDAVAATEAKAELQQIDNENKFKDQIASIFGSQPNRQTSNSNSTPRFINPPVDISVEENEFISFFLQQGGTINIPDERALMEVSVSSTATRKPLFKKVRPALKQVKTLEEEEAEIRNKKPQRGFIEKSVDFVQGNIDEYIVNPLKQQASKILPESLDFDPNLTTTRSDFDNTEGTRPYLLNNKSISEIRQEKNISFNQISNSKYGNALIPLKLKKRIVNSIYPQGYEPDPKAFWERFKSPEALGDDQLERLSGKAGDHREDIFLMYTGLPQKHDSFTMSSFKAGSESDTNITFKDPKVVLSYLKTAALRTDLFDKLASGEITPESIKESNNSELKGAEKIHKASFRDPQNVMWNATFGIGFDEAGKPYLSFYDNWDLKGKDDFTLTKGVFGSPIEIYDRIPLTDKLIQILARTKLVKQSNTESDKDAKADKAKGIDTQFKERFKDVEVQEEMNKILNSLKRRLQ